MVDIAGYFEGFRCQGSMFRVQGSGFKVQGSGFKVQRLQPRETAHPIDQDPAYQT